MLRHIVLIVLLGLMASPLGACGRRGALDAPDGSKYPRSYPIEKGTPSAPATPDETTKKNR